MDLQITNPVALDPRCLLQKQNFNSMTLFPFVLDTTSLEVDASEAENNNRHSLETSHTLWGSDEEQTNLSKNRTVRLVPLKKVITKYSTRH